MRHRASLSLCAGLAVALLACSRPASPASQPPGPTPEQPGSDATRPGGEPGQPPAEPGAELPAGKFGNVPGWLGFAVQPADKRQLGWTPAHPNASVVILDAEDWSETVEEGTKLRLVAREGNLPLTFSETSQIPYGCDNNALTMAAFRTPNDLAEQTVWILPDEHEAAEALAVTAGAVSKTQRTWTVGPLTMTVKLDGKHKGRLEVKRGSEQLLARPFEKGEMEGADKSALDLRKDLEIGVPYPAAAFRIDPQLTIVVLRALSYEGVNFEVLALRDKLDSAGTQYVYLCAF